MNLYTDLFNIKTEKDFAQAALGAFKLQFARNKVYNQWCKLTGIKSENDVSLEDIYKNNVPFLPINFFKTHDIKSTDRPCEDYFLSSGTGNMSRSRHNVFDKNLYLKNAEHCFNHFFKNTEDYCYIFLLPNYMEQQHSSLICMADYFAKKSKYKSSSFFKNPDSDAVKLLESNERSGIPTVLFGVTYALLDMAEKQTFNLKHTIVFETGGMKGRRQEMPKTEVHNILKKRFGIENIASEYGMCELFSQAYSVKDGKFFCPPQMNVAVNEINDPKSKDITDKNGIINIIDLANIDTCCFIQTEDVGQKHSDGSFSITGRLDRSALRGCNLMYNQ